MSETMRSRIQPRDVAVVLIAVGAIGVGLFDGINGLAVVPYAVVGALLVARRPDNRISWLVLGLSWTLALFELPGQFTTAQLHAGGLPPLGFGLEVIQYWAGGVLLTALYAIGVLFPTGQLPPGRARRPAVAGFVIIIVVLVISLAGPTVAVYATDAIGTIDIASPTAIIPRGFVGSLATNAWYLLLVLDILAVGWMLARLRRAQGIEAAQLRWLAWSLAAIFLTFVIGLVGQAVTTNGLGGLVYVPVEVAFSLPPIAIGVAILRYRLYDIDLIVRRTAVYVSLTAILAGLYAASITLLQKVFIAATGDRSDGAVILSTLILATLFNPVKTAIQGFVDTRFQAAPDAERRIDEFVGATAALLAEPSEQRVLRGYLRLAMELSGAAGGAIRGRMGGAGSPRSIVEPRDWHGQAAVVLAFAGVAGPLTLELGHTPKGADPNAVAVEEIRRGARELRLAIASGELDERHLAEAGRTDSAQAADLGPGESMPAR